MPHRLAAAIFPAPSPTHWLIYEWALNAAGTNIMLYGATFTAGHVMNSGPRRIPFTVGGSTPVEFSPTTEFLNGGNDQVFVSGITLASPNFIEYNMNAFLALFPNSFPPVGATGATASESGGTSGIIVDNTSGSAQASSIYFGVSDDAQRRKADAERPALTAILGDLTSNGLQQPSANLHVCVCPLSTSPFTRAAIIHK